MIVWGYLQLLMQSVSITINVVSSNPAHGYVYSIEIYVTKFICDFQQIYGLLRVLRIYPLPPPPNKADRHNIAEILLHALTFTLIPIKSTCIHQI